ncbi:MAG: riboflavin synthase [Pseudomonadales bacterium]|jgi:riboflavin synthase|nr:riboflavin synthase [Pseudomonadales bacterium]
MFTGIIEATGRISAIRERGGDWRLGITSDTLDFSDVRPGDSIAVSGVCLTALDIHAVGFSADVSRETLACTTLAALEVGAAVNLEKALTPHSRLGGHLVSGHVDGIAHLLRRHPDGRSERLTFQLPQELARYVAPKGSICIDGVSLTVNAVQGSEFGVNIIPHTAARTTLHDYRVGRRVNLEVDVISRYLERLLQARGEGRGEMRGLTLEQLSQAGF